VCAGLCQLLYWYALYAINLVLLARGAASTRVDAAHRFVFSALCALAMASHLVAMTTNPGAVPSSDSHPPAGSRHGELMPSAGDPASTSRRRYRNHCRRCVGYKPQRAYHCATCARCVVKMDHHCPWVNNCIGVGNHKLFLLFLGCVEEARAAAAAAAAALVLRPWRTPPPNRPAHSRYTCAACADAIAVLVYLIGFAGTTHLKGNAGMHIAFVFVVAFLFIMFTTCMLADQWDVISTGTTQLEADRAKRAKREARGGSDSDSDDSEDAEGERRINEVFGGTTDRWRLDWLVPVPARFPASAVEELVGFQRLAVPPSVELGSLGLEDAPPPPPLPPSEAAAPPHTQAEIIQKLGDDGELKLKLVVSL